MADLNELKTLGTDPIPGDNPVGESVQFDDDYEELRTEVKKLDSVTKEPVEWSLVIDKASDILKSRSKNLLAAIYLTYGLYETRDYAGLETGLTICRDLLTTYWETLDPPLKRKRGRIEAFAWLGERGGRVAEDRQPAGDEKEALDNCAALIDEINKLLQEKLADDAPDLGDLQRAVKQYIKDFEAAARAAEEKKRKAAERAASGEIELNSVDDARRELGKVRNTAKQICDFLRKTDNSDPAPYRLIRSISWGLYKEAPPNENGSTKIPAPAPELSTRCFDLEQKQDWANLIEAGEAAFTNAIFWLDIHRWVVLGLKGLGPTHEAAADAVMLEIGALVSRFPELPKLKFANDSPLASPDTETWLEKDVLPRMSSGDGAPSSGGDSESNEPEELAEKSADARRLAGGGNLPQAIRIMQEGMASTGERRGQFLWRLGLAKLCLDSGQPLLATPHLEELEDLIQRHELETWEPKLCLSVYTALLSARRMLLKDQRRATPELMQKTNQLQDRLCRLDAATALALSAR
ncbi:MAG: type VI secretion system protein TssA [candidate division Zixibacteria bacterium]|nr:type VI secretion system protein TssA [candidate division Zixibacteria bacterium]